MTEMLPIGTKVIPHSKSKGVSFPCSEWLQASKKQGYLYIVDYNEDEGAYELKRDGRDGGGNFYLRSDFTLYDNILNEGDEL